MFSRRYFSRRSSNVSLNFIRRGREKSLCGVTCVHTIPPNQAPSPVSKTSQRMTIPSMSKPRRHGRFAGWKVGRKFRQRSVLDKHNLYSA